MSGCPSLMHNCNCARCEAYQESPNYKLAVKANTTNYTLECTIAVLEAKNKQLKEKNRLLKKEIAFLRAAYDNPRSVDPNTPVAYIA